MRSVRVDGFSDRRAVSDTLGFVLIFGIIVSTTAVVYVGGFDALTGARDAQQFSNTERAFDILDSNVDDLAVRGAPSRATEVLLSDGALGFGEPVTFNVSTDGGASYQATTRPVVYRADDGDRLVYSNGALFRQYGDRAVLFSEPRVSAGDRTLVPIVATEPASRGVSTDGTQRVLVRTTVSARDVESFSTPANLTVTSPRAAAWEQYLEAEFGQNCDGPADGRTGEVECPLPGEGVYVQGVYIDVAVA
ncbi:DUF7289 family protein [Halobacterium noricense]|uniref:DUF7289 family protein n=1 Tax=Halobacterium noricense TaxID=223182 RepID=UPI001E3C0BA7|nr:hypothetical protein [Halobacterium noricense]UHH26111.1 hypothetical protein LT974_04055 [Halobacterium noricense]